MTTSVFHRTRGDPGRGLRALARSLGRAAGVVRRLVPSGVSKSAAASPSRGTHRTAFAHRRRHLKDEVRRLEEELERLHLVITTGDGAPNLERAIRRARVLRQELEQRRDELSRVERHLTREQWLGSQPSRSTGVARAAPPKKKEGWDSPSREPGWARRQRAARAVIDAWEFRERSRRVAYETIAQQLFSDNAEARRETIAQLAGLKSRLSAKLLAIATEDPDGRVSLDALQALVASADRVGVEIFRRFLRAPDASRRVAALRGLAGADSGANNSVFIAALDDTDPPVRAAAAAVLGWRRASDSVGALTTLLRDPDESVRLAGVEALASIGADRGVLSLIRSLSDESLAVREAAERALRSILGSDVDGIGAGLQAEERVDALKAWWREARVDKQIEVLEVGPIEPRIIEPVRARAERPARVAGPVRVSEQAVAETQAEATGAAAEDRDAAGQTAGEAAGGLEERGALGAGDEEAAAGEEFEEIAAEPAETGAIGEETEEQPAFEEIAAEHESVGIDEEAEAGEAFENIFGDEGPDLGIVPEGEGTPGEESSGEAEEGEEGGFESLFGDDEGSEEEGSP